MDHFHYWVAFDTETSGLGPDARILEIALVLFEAGEVKETWSQLLWPEGLDWESDGVKQALAVNQLRKEDLEGKPTFAEIHEELLDRLAAQMVWVAHNAEFDTRMLSQELRRLGDFPLPDSLIFDTMALDYRMNPAAGVHRLTHVAKRWGVDFEGEAHRAATDATACGRVLHRMIGASKIPLVWEQAEAFQKEASAAWKTSRPRRRYS